MLVAVLIVIISLIVCLSIFSLIFKMFFSNIIIFDGIITGIAAATLCGCLWSVHTVFCILIGISICVGFVLLHIFKIGFWIVSPLMSLAWAFFLSIITYEFSRGDWIWTIAIGCVTASGVIGLHISARRKLLLAKQNNADINDNNTDNFNHQ